VTTTTLIVWRRGHRFRSRPSSRPRPSWCAWPRSRPVADRPDGLPKQLTKYGPGDRAERGDDRAPGLLHARATWSKTMLIEAPGHVQIDVPRDRAGTFIPEIVKNRQRRLSGVAGAVLSLFGSCPRRDQRALRRDVRGLRQQGDRFPDVGATRSPCPLAPVLIEALADGLEPTLGRRQPHVQCGRVSWRPVGCSSF
jgi:hypothetical protein